jgi:beta-glucosidase
MKKAIFILSALFLAGSLAAQQLPYQNRELSSEQRAEDLCSRLTLEEKVSLMMNTSPAIPRLGIKEFNWWSEALHGIGRNGLATVFPNPTGMAASWDDELLFDCFTAASDEARVKYQQAKKAGHIGVNQCLSFWTPNINIFRDPRWGRGQETYGEDPYLTGRMGSAVVRGLQGPEDSEYRKTLACAKHFAVHSGPEWNRHVFNVTGLSDRDLYETYLPAFKTLVEDAHVAEVMCAYQRFDGKPCCGNDRLLQQILRKDWGFQGIVTSDCGAIYDFYHKGFHEYSKDAAEASAVAVLTGTDTNCGGSYAALTDAVARGLITEKDIDVSVKRLLKLRFELGEMDPDEYVSWTKIPESVVASKEHHDLAVQMARESIVLLQNKNGILPLRKDEEIVVMGANAIDSTMLWGNYNGFPSHTTTILEGIMKKASNVRYIDGFGLVQNRAAINDMVRAAGSANTVIFVGGISPRLEGEQMDVNVPGFKGGDRTDIELPKAQRDAIAALHLAGKKVIFVNCSGGAIAMVPETQNADAIIQAWYGGEAGGQAVADVIFGDYNPSGKLPVTFYASTSQLPDYQDYNMEGHTYRYFKGEPLFPFGYGLSYTDFSFGETKYKRHSVRVEVSNTGSMDGDAVVEIYVRDPRDTEGPVKTLRGFKRVPLKAGESKKVSIDFPRSSFELWDAESSTMKVVPGTYELMVGSSSAEKDLQTIQVKVR